MLGFVILLFFLFFGVFLSVDHIYFLQPKVLSGNRQETDHLCSQCRFLSVCYRFGGDLCKQILPYTFTALIRE